MATKRIPLITWMQLFGCICVILGHSYPFVVAVPKWLETTQLFLYAFHMPLFVFCSGLLISISKSAEKYTFYAFFKRRAVRLLIPYTVFSFIGIVPKILLSPFLNDHLNFDFWQLVRAFLVPRENIWGHFWFLPMIFFCGLIGYWLIRLQKRLPWMSWIVLASSFLLLYIPPLTDWLALDDLLHNLFYFVFGIGASKFYQNTEKLNNLRCYVVGIVFFAVALLLFWFTEINETGQLAKPFIACTMILTISLLLKSLSERVPFKKESLLNRSYSIFILSWPCQLVVELVLERFLTMPIWCIMPCMFVTGLVVPCIIILFTDRIEKKSKRKIIRHLIGG